MQFSGGRGAAISQHSATCRIHRSLAHFTGITTVIITATTATTCCDVITQRRATTATAHAGVGVLSGCRCCCGRCCCRRGCVPWFACRQPAAQPAQSTATTAATNAFIATLTARHAGSNH